MLTYEIKDRQANTIDVDIAGTVFCLKAIPPSIADNIIVCVLSNVSYYER
jgi:hypothetical protein